MAIVTKQTKTYIVTVGDIKGNNTAPQGVTRVDRAELLSAIVLPACYFLLLCSPFLKFVSEVWSQVKR